MQFKIHVQKIGKILSTHFSQKNIHFVKDVLKTTRMCNRSFSIYKSTSIDYKATHHHDHCKVDPAELW
jgi:hypothetical protein